MKRNYSKIELEDLLKSTDNRVVIDALMYLCFNINDSDWIQEKCIYLIMYGKNDDIKGLGITCLGHVARIYGKINKDLVIPILQKKLQDISLAGRAQDAIEDIEIFAK